MPYVIRHARTDEAELLLALEDDAGRLYGQVGMPEDLEGLPLQLVADAIADQLVWVVVDSSDQPVAFALCWIRGDALHLRELDVHPDHMRRGLGRQLVEFVSERARERGLSRVTLTTYRDVPWNAGLYRRWGFAELEPAKQPGWLAELRAEEDLSSIGRWPRVAMSRPVTAG